jgi:hypothetical protein
MGFVIAGYGKERDERLIVVLIHGGGPGLVNWEKRSTTGMVVGEEHELLWAELGCWYGCGLARVLGI